MKIRRRAVGYIIVFALGALLFGLNLAGLVDEFWSGMGSGLMAVSLLRLIQLFRLHKDESYREKYETEVSDERNSFIRGKAWAWAGYLFILIMSVSVIVLRVMGQNVLSIAASCAVCLMLLLFWGSYMVLKRKY